MTGREFEADGVAVRRGWWRTLTRAGRLRIGGARLTLLTSYGVEIDSEVLARVRATAPWYAPAGFVRLVLAGRTYWIRLKAQHARKAVEAVTAWRRDL
ncbi:hypothetical protein [Streptomyces sp. TRM70350]|uniref:hypothetical protein n=1 Tax=Streptomyces sp. TRM70350 TaxID=2856165 RepID=UPI001C4867CA|nr:hypothetical protein [Streptomyces sp. TRM70350]MBV7697440.1 hypothetical protein [Streptomyces sp. TRM70350]